MQAEKVKRADPTKRTLVPPTPGAVRNGRPDRKYMLANPGDEIHGLAMKLETGWTAIDGGPDKDKERIFGGAVDPNNGRVTFQGQVLIWKPLDVWTAEQNQKRALERARIAKSRSKNGLEGNLEGRAEDWDGAAAGE